MLLDLSPVSGLLGIPMNDREKAIIAHEVADRNGAVDILSVSRFFAVCSGATFVWSRRVRESHVPAVSSAVVPPSRCMVTSVGFASRLRHPDVVCVYQLLVPAAFFYRVWRVYGGCVAERLRSRNGCHGGNDHAGHRLHEESGTTSKRGVCVWCVSAVVMVWECCY